MPVFYDIIEALAEEVETGLPGWEAQKLMIVPGRGKVNKQLIEKKKPKISGVLIWLFPKGDEIYTRLILRTPLGKVHAGQVGFPGGKYEETDKDLWTTAIREASEEIGLATKKIKRIGELTTIYIPPSNFWVHPFIGFSENEMPSVINSVEVQRTIDLNIQTLLDPKIKAEKLILHSSSTKEQKTPYYNVEGFTVWGATAMMLSELEELLRRTYKKLS